MNSRYAIAFFAAVTALTLIAGTSHAVEVGEAAPSFSLATAHGETITLSSLRGRIVYVDFWASWCAPCRRSFPWMNEMLQRYADRGLTVVAINVDRRRSDADQFLQTNAASFAIVYDDHGATPLAYSVQGMPSSYLIDAHGTVVAVEQGFRDDRRNALEDRIRSLLAAR